MCTSRRSFEMSIPTKSWFMTRPCRCGLWRPERLYGLEIEPVGRAPSSVTVFADLDVHGLPPTLPLAVPTTEGDGKIQGVALPRRREGTTSQRRRCAVFSALLLFAVPDHKTEESRPQGGGDVAGGGCDEGDADGDEAEDRKSVVEGK